MHLYLLRHAEAAHAAPDFERPLTAKGRTDAVALGRLLTRQGIDVPNAIWCSPYLRARQTAECLLGAAGAQVPIDVRDGLTPGDNPVALLPALAALEEDLLVVGHNPHLAILSECLLGGPDGHVNVHYPKATLLCFEHLRPYSTQHAPAWTLCWMLTPRLYRPPA